MSLNENESISDITEARTLENRFLVLPSYCHDHDTRVRDPLMYRDKRVHAECLPQHRLTYNATG